MDLWAFDDDLDLEETPADTHRAKDLPEPRGAQPDTDAEPSQAAEPKIPASSDLIKMNVNKPKFKARPGQAAGQAKPESDFDDLDHWEDVPPDADIGELPQDADRLEATRLEPQPEMRRSIADSTTKVPEKTTPDDSKKVEDPAPIAAPPSPTDDDEFSPVVPQGAVPVSLRPKLGLTQVERIGLGLLAGLLVAAGIAIFAVFLNRLPTESANADVTDFPIKGKHVSITSARSFWRVPHTDGAMQDIVRRGTALIPVLELDIGKASGAVRVLFRNDEGIPVGDGVTRTALANGKLEIPATAGFDDAGMHAAYRTGQSKPWTVEVFEAPSGGGEFQSLFQTSISTVRR